MRVTLPLLVGSLILSGCTPTEESRQSANEAAARTSEERRDFVAASSLEVPTNWSYMVTRQGAEAPRRDSWNFTMSPFSFNLGRRCDPQTGPLVGSLFKRAQVFITGSAHRSDFPISASPYEQEPGSFHLDDATLANYEGFCVPTYRIDFELDDYYVSTHVAVHQKARQAVIDEALAALNSIR